MLRSKRFRWLPFLVIALVVASVGLYVGKQREGAYIGQLYARTDFTLLDDDNEFFRLRDFAPERLLLLVFTPDELDPELVPAFRDFASHLGDLRRMGVEAMLVSRTNREIARNFKQAARFSGRLLLDTSGTVGRNIGIWPGFDQVSYWGYAVVDAQNHVFWTGTEHRPKTYAELRAELQKLK